VRRRKRERRCNKAGRQRPPR